MRTNDWRVAGIHFEGSDIVTRGFTGEIARWRLPPLPTAPELARTVERAIRCLPLRSTTIPATSWNKTRTAISSKARSAPGGSSWASAPRVPIGPRAGPATKHRRYARGSRAVACC